jgi:hypothetical protein
MPLGIPRIGIGRSSRKILFKVSEGRHIELNFSSIFQYIVLTGLYNGFVSIFLPIPILGMPKGTFIPLFAFLMKKAKPRLIDLAF